MSTIVRPKSVLKLVLGLVAALIMWMALVDRTWSVFICHDCGAYANVLTYHLAGLTLSSKTVERKTSVQRVAEDLGKPCQHMDSIQYAKHRLWGLVWCACPCINGTDYLIGEDRYDARMSEAVRTRRAANPNSADEFHQRVIVNHDGQFLAQFRESLTSTAQ